MAIATFRPHLRLNKSHMPVLKTEKIIEWLKHVFTIGIENQLAMEEHVLSETAIDSENANAYKKYTQTCIGRLEQAQQSVQVVDEKDYWMVSFDVKNDSALFDRNHPEFQNGAWLIDEIDVTIIQRLKSAAMIFKIDSMFSIEHPPSIQRQELSIQLDGFIQAMDEVSASCLKNYGQENPMYFIKELR